MSPSDSIENARTSGRHGRAWGEPVPLTQQPWNWGVALTWFGGIVFSLCTIAALVWWVRMAWFAVQVVAG